MGRLDLKEFFDVGNDPDGTPDETVDYVYDKLGRLKTTTDSANGPTTNTYDTEGRLTQVISPEGTVNYEYQSTTGRLERTYTGTADPDETSAASDGKAVTDTRYEYDILGRLSKVSVHERNDTPLGTPEDTVYTYDVLGNLDTMTLPSGVVSDYIYDELGRLTELTHFAPEDSSGDPNSYEDNAVLGMFEYELLLDGRRAAVDETDDQGRVTQIDWFYDNLGRLTGEAYDSHDDDLDFISEYRFDLVGNRLQKLTDDSPTVAELDAYLTDRTFTPDETIGYDYDANDRLLEEELDTGADGTIDKTTVYEYGGPTNPHTEQTKKTVWQGTDTDPATGTKDSETTFGYNLQGRLASATVDKTGSGGSVTNTSYTYNDSGIRTSQTVDAQTTEYVIDSNNLTGYAQVLEEHVAGQLTKTYTIGHDVIAQQSPSVESGDTLFLVYDGHGSTRALLNSSGAIVTDQVFHYDAYGNAVGFDAANALTTILYAGEQFDVATDQHYLRARYYDAAIGRFNRDDPYGGNINDPQSLHKYVYAYANPIMGIDPSGMMNLTIAFASMGMRAGFAAGQFLVAAAPAIQTATTLAGVIWMTSTVLLICEEAGFVPKSGYTEAVSGISAAVFTVGFSLTIMSDQLRRILDPLRGSTGTLLSANMANQQSLQRHPGWTAPYRPRTLAAEGRIAPGVRLVRFFSPNASTNPSRGVGAFTTTVEEAAGLNWAQVQSRFGLANPPTHMSFTTATGNRAVLGIAARNFNQQGLGLQVELIDEAVFTNAQPFHILGQ